MKSIDYIVGRWIFACLLACILGFFAGFSQVGGSLPAMDARAAQQHASAAWGQR